MLPHPLPPEIQQALWQAQEIGVCVDFAFYAVPPDASAGGFELHRQAALAGEQAFTGWADEVRHLWPPNVKNPNWPSTTPEKMGHQAVTAAEFLGRVPEDGDWETHGFQYAFLDPPYRLWCPPEEGQQLCQTLANFLTAGNPHILRWSDDWSGYFDAGKEWWGTFFWTIHHAEQGWIAAVGASTTD